VTPLDIYYCGGSQVAGMGLPVTQAMPVQVTRALRERWGRKLGHAYMLEYSGDPRDLERALRARRISRPFILVIVPRNVYVWGVPQVGDLRQNFRGVAAFDAGVIDVVPHDRPPGPLGAAAAPPFPALGAAVGPPLAAPAKLGRRAWRTPPAEVRRRAWLATRSALKALWYAGWLPTLPWWVLRYDRALRSLRQLARQAGCRLLVVATPVPLCVPSFQTPGLHWYVALLARYLRAQAGGEVVVADLYARLQDPSPEPLHFRHDRMVHLTAAGTRRAAEVVVDAICTGLPSADRQAVARS